MLRLGGVGEVAAGRGWDAGRGGRLSPPAMDDGEGPFL
jgi:hypothetical protein